MMLNAKSTAIERTKDKILFLKPISNVVMFKRNNKINAETAMQGSIKSKFCPFTEIISSEKFVVTFANKENKKDKVLIVRYFKNQ